MAERKNTNPFASEDTSSHHPPAVYQPNPYPYNPAEGNPWAPTSDQYQNIPKPEHAYSNTSSTYSYGHGYNTSSDSGSQSGFPTYMPMPNPSDYNTNNGSYNYSYDTNANAYNNNAYNNNAYNNNAYNNNTYNNTPTYNAYSNTNDENSSQGEHEHDDDRDKNEPDNNTENIDEASAVNPGIETHDPDKLKISSQKVTSLNGTPNNWRFLSRFIQFLASAGAFIFIVGAGPFSKRSMPDEANKAAIIFLYIVSCLSIIYSFGHLIVYCLRRWRNKNKAPRWILMFADAILGASFGTLMVFLIKDFRCKPGDLDGWCNFYNTSIFFTVLAFVTYAVSFVWDIVGGFKR